LFSYIDTDGAITIVNVTLHSVTEDTVGVVYFLKLHQNEQQLPVNTSTQQYCSHTQIMDNTHAKNTRKITNNFAISIMHTHKIINDRNGDTIIYKK